MFGRSICKTFGFLSAILVLVSCTSAGEQIRSINRTAADIKATIRARYNIVSSVDNGREVITGPLKIDPKDKTPRDQLRERCYMRIVIVGDRRPYDVLVEAYIERKTPEGKWEEEGLDEDLSHELAQELHKYLIESREHWNFIDDFRAF